MTFTLCKDDTSGQKSTPFQKRPPHTQTKPQRSPKLDSHHEIRKSAVKLFLSIRADLVQWHSPSARIAHLNKNSQHSTCNHPTPRFRSKDSTHITTGEKRMWQKFCPLGQTIFTEIYWNMFVPGRLLWKKSPLFHTTQPPHPDSSPKTQLTPQSQKIWCETMFVQ